MNKPRSIEIVVQNNMCIGCGVCAAVCPAQVLTMKFNVYGEYNPVKNADCRENCDFCLQVCPFSEKEENEDTLANALFGHADGIKHRPETGYYLDSYVGYSNVNDHRAHGASGGMATWLLETLLLSDSVDHVICVTPHNDPEKLFRFAVFDDAASIRQSAKSAYYPVEMSEVVRHVIENEGRYAITGLPCFIKALKLAAKKNKKLQERIAFTIGLVCGQMKSKQYTSYLALTANVPGKLKSVSFRGKSPGESAYNYFFHCIDKENNQGKLFVSDATGKVWFNPWFAPNVCAFCDDVFAELADVTVMDAWLPEYFMDWKGTNLMIVRASLLHRLIETGIEKGQLKGKRISIDQVIQSQLSLLHVKRNQLAYRLYLAKKNGMPVPTKRITPSGKLNLLDRKIIALKDKMQRESKELFLQYSDEERVNLKAFSEEMNCLVNELENWNQIGRIVRFPVRVMRKVSQNVQMVCGER